MCGVVQKLPSATPVVPPHGAKHMASRRQETQQYRLLPSYLYFSYFQNNLVVIKRFTQHPVDPVVIEPSARLGGGRTTNPVSDQLHHLSLEELLVGLKSEQMPLLYTFVVTRQWKSRLLSHNYLKSI